MLSYLEFLKNKDLQAGLRSLVETPSKFIEDITKIKGRVRPLFFKEVFQIEPSNIFKFTRIEKINPREETEKEYQIVESIRAWLWNTYAIPFSQSAYQATIWKTTIPTVFDRKYNVAVFPQSDRYTMITFGTTNIINDLIKKNIIEQKEVSDYLNEQKKKGKIKKGRITGGMIHSLDSGDLVFFISPSYVYLPSTSKDLFVYIRQMIYDDVSPST